MTLETYACLFLFFCFSPPCHSPAERAVLGCQLGPACTSQGRERKTRPDTAREHSGLQHSPCSHSPHSSSDFSQAERAGRKGGTERKRRKKDWAKVSWKERYKKARGRSDELDKSRKNTHSAPHLHLLHSVWASIQIHSRLPGTKPLHVSTKQAHMTEKNFWNGAPAATNPSTVTHWAAKCETFIEMYLAAVSLCWFIKNRTIWLIKETWHVCV